MKPSSFSASTSHLVNADTLGAKAGASKKANDFEATEFSSNYGFCKFRIPSSGGRVIWEVTNECNYACTYCIFSSTGRKPEGELETSEVYKALRDLKENNFNHIKFTGGEPFLRPDMLGILRYAKNLGLNCDISTNASLITPIIAQGLKELNLSMVHVSLDGHTQEIHESVRGKKSFEKTLTGLTLLKEASVGMRIGCVIHKNNEEELKEMIDFAQSFNAKEIIFSMMEPAGRLQEASPLLASLSAQTLINKIEEIISTNSYLIKISHNLSSLVPTPQEVKFINSKIAPILTPSTPSLSNSNASTQSPTSVTPTSCPGGAKFLFINSLGQVSPCTWVSDRRPEFLSFKIQHAPLNNILRSPSFLKLKELSNLHLNSCPAPLLTSLAIAPIKKSNL